MLECAEDRNYGKFEYRIELKQAIDHKQRKANRPKLTKKKANRPKLTKKKANRQE